MPPEINVREIGDVRLLANLVAALNPLTSYSEVPSALAAAGGGSFPSQLYPRTPPQPAWVWLDTGNQVVVAVSGILTPLDGLNVFASSLQPLTSGNGWRASAAAVGSAAALYSALAGRFVSGPRRWVLSGHSYGGVVLCALAGLLSNGGVVSDLQLATFGSPRPGDSTLRDLLTRYTVRRFMNAGDPVPRFPPHVNEAPALTLAAGFPTALQWSRYVQPNGGVVLWPDGALSIAQLPPGVLPITDLQLAGWAVSDRGFFATSHAMAQYQLRVTLAAMGQATVSNNPLPGSGPERAVPLTEQEFRDAAAAGAPVTPRAEVLPMSQGYIPPIFRAKALKLGPGSYGVLWFNGTIMMGHNRSNARALANKLNLFLRVMQGAASVDHTAFNAALANYWTVCTESSLGFNPPLVVT